MYYLYLLARRLSLTFPRSFCYYIASLLADLKFIFSPRDRKEITYNLRPLIKKKSLRREVRQVFRNFALYLVDFFRFSQLDRRFIDRYVEIKGREHLLKAKNKKKGVIILTAHLGNYELGGAVASLIGYKIYAIALPHKDKRINSFFNYQRNLCGVKVVSTGVSIKKCIQLLRNNEMVAFLGDKDFTSKGMKVELCGKEAFLPRGPAYFSLKTGACILPSFFIRENQRYYRLIFEQPIFPTGERGAKEEQEIIEEYKKVLEKYILKYPTQWYMFRKYWL